MDEAQENLQYDQCKIHSTKRLQDSYPVLNNIYPEAFHLPDILFPYISRTWALCQGLSINTLCTCWHFKLMIDLHLQNIPQPFWLFKLYQWQKHHTVQKTHGLLPTTVSSQVFFWTVDFSNRTTQWPNSMRADTWITYRIHIYKSCPGTHNNHTGYTYTHTNVTFQLSVLPQTDSGSRATSRRLGILRF